MASGKVHAMVTVVASVAILATSVKFGWNVLPITLGCLTGLVLSPDLDIDKVTYSERLVSKKFGCFLGIFWYLFWLPYAKIVPHRNQLSHAPLLGTAIRVGYLSLLFIPVFLVVEYLFPGWLSWFYTANAAWIWLGIGGLVISDVLHTLFDLRVRL